MNNEWMIGINEQSMNDWNKWTIRINVWIN